VHAQNEAIIFGGVDPANSPTNVFQTSFVSLASAFTKNGWQVEPLFGSQADCTGCNSSWDVDPIARAAGKSPTDIPRASKTELLRKLDSAIAALKSGDQLFLEINTHGVSAFPGGHESVSLAVYDEADPNGSKDGIFDSTGHQFGSMLVNDPDLIQRFRTLKNRGVRLAFGNDSCFGGPAAKLLEKYGCVITQTSSSKYGLGEPISDSLVSALTENSRLLSPILVSGDGRVEMEDVFLGAVADATYGINSPYYRPPFAGVLEPQFSGDLAQYDSIEALSGKWLSSLPASEFSVQNGEAIFSGSPSDFLPLQNFTQQFVVPFLDVSKDSIYKNIALHHLKTKLSQLASTDVDTPSELSQKVMGATSDLQKIPAIYQGLSASIQNLRSDLQKIGLILSFQLNPQYSEGQASFVKALETLNGKSISLTPLSQSASHASSWISMPLSIAEANGSRRQSFFSPTDAMFKASTLTAATVIAQEMSETYPTASTPAFRNTLTQSIATSEAQAWNSLSSEARNRLSEIQQIGDLEDEEVALLNEGSGLRFVQFAIEARIYSYLFHRGKIGANDPDVSACAGFTLRNL
jgi:hypothetical protein